MSWSGLVSNKLSVCGRLATNVPLPPGVERVAVAGDEADPVDNVVARRSR